MGLFNTDEEIDLNDQKGIAQVKAVKRPLLEHDQDHDYILRIDNTTLEIFQGCPRAAQFYCVNRRQAVPSAALQFGGAVHVGLETLYREGFFHVHKAIDAALRNLDEIKFRDPDEWRTATVLADTIEKYVEKYEHDDAIKPISINGVKFIERPFSLVLGEIQINSQLHYDGMTLTQDDNHPSNVGLFIDKLTVLWSGRIDIAAHYGDDHVYVVDHKTSSIGGPQFFADFMLSQQMVGYNWALRRMLPDHKVFGTVVNAIMQRRPTKSGRALEFERQVYFHTKWHIDEWERDVMSQVETFVNSLVEGFFPKQTKQCFGRYGKCPYHDVCTLPPTQRHLILDGNDFSNVTWSPLDAR